MKVKVSIVREVEIETNDPAIIELDKYWRTSERDDSSCDSLVDDAIKVIENETRLPFGDDTAPETILGVYAMDGETILEW